MPEIILHQWHISPFCGKVRKALEFKLLPFKLNESYNGFASFKVPSLSRQGTLPVLDYAGQRLVDSTHIVHFLEQHHPDPPLLPADPRQAALAQLWNDWADNALFWMEAYLRVHNVVATKRAAALISTGRPAWESHAMVPIFKWVYGRRCKAQGLGRMSEQEVMQRFDGYLATIDASLAPGPWLVGEQRSLADIAVSAQLDEIQRTSVEAGRLENHPRLMAWLKRNRASDATAEPASGTV